MVSPRSAPGTPLVRTVPRMVKGVFWPGMENASTTFVPVRIFAVDSTNAPTWLSWVMMAL